MTYFEPILLMIAALILIPSAILGAVPITKRDTTSLEIGEILRKNNHKI